MRKIMAFLLLIAFLFTLAACDTVSEPVPTTQATSPGEPVIVPDEPYMLYSPYVLNAYIQDVMGEDYALYCDLVDALLDYDCEISGFQSEEHFVALWSTLRDEFLPAEVLCADWINSDQPYVYNDGTVQLVFRLPQEEHNKILKDFAEKIQSDLSILEEEDSETDCISKLYTRVLAEMNCEESKVASYENIMTGEGNSEDYTKYLMILLEQIGVECYYATAIGEDTMAHTWVVAKMDGQYYHFDPAWQESFVDGFWFGVDDALRKASLLNAWRYAFLSGGNWESIRGDGVTLVGKTCWLTIDKIPLPECPTAYVP